MNIKGGNPPSNTKENCKKLGFNKSSVEVLGLESVIRKMKKRRSGYGDMTIANEINDTILKDSEDKISHMVINRWWRKHREDEEPDIGMVNIYGSHLSSLKSITRQLEMIEMYLDNLNDSVSNVDEVAKVSKVVNEMTGTFDKLTMRKTSLLGQIGDIQARVYTYVNFGTVLGKFEEEMMAKDEIWYYQVMKRITSDPLLAEVLRKITEENKG